MSLRAKECPFCGGKFYRRNTRIENDVKVYVCPCCDEPLHIENGNAVSAKDRAAIKRVYDHFFNTYMSQRAVYYGPPGCSAYMQQMGYAKNVVSSARTYLGYNKEFTIHPADFAIECIDHIFTAPDKAAWAAKIDTLAMCNGGVFASSARKVLTRIRKEQEEEKINRQRLNAIDMDGFDVQLAL
jgi:hypothetical protein